MILVVTVVVVVLLVVTVVVVAVVGVILVVTRVVILEVVLLLVGCLLACLTSQQQASVSQGRVCSDNFTCCHTEIEVANQTFYLTQSQYIDTGPTNPSVDPITPGAWQGSHWSANFEVTGMTRILSQAGHRLVGLVVKASASRAEDPFESRPPGIFSGSSHTRDSKIGNPVATLPGAWCYRVSAGTGRPGVSIL